MKFSAFEQNQIIEIKEMFTQSFSNSEGEKEGEIIGQLAYELMTITDPAGLNVFVAMQNDKVVGSIIFTPLILENTKNVFLLSPVAVHSEHQNKGVGQKLIEFGLNALKQGGGKYVFTYGDPKYYGKVGFAFMNEVKVKAPFTLTYPEGWLARSLISDDLEIFSAHSSCVQALNNAEYW